MLKKSDERGLSNTFIIILLIVLIIIVSGVIFVLMKNTASENIVEKDYAYLRIYDVQIINSSDIYVKFNRNDSNENLNGIIFIFYDKMNSEIARQNVSIEELKSDGMNVTLNVGNTSNLGAISIEPIFVSKTGEEVQGEIEDSWKITRCIPNCINKKCGSNGCGGSCGTCSGSSDGGSSGGGGSSNNNTSACTDTCSSLEYQCGIQTICSSTVNCGNCSTGQVCNIGNCVNQSTCTDSCSSSGYTCGTRTICGNVTNCGTCSNGNCNVNGTCMKVIPEEENFIFTYWPIYLYNPTDTVYAKNMKAIDDMNATGMNYAGIYFRPLSNAEPSLSSLRNKGYKLALEISAGHYTWGSNLPELVDKTADNGNQFFSAPCLDKIKCEYWSESPSPAYTGTLWQNTLENTGNVTKRTQPEIVLFDNELWGKPENTEWYFTGGDPNNDCNCRVINQSIGYQAYYSSWYQRGIDLRKKIEEVSPNTKTILFYNEVASPAGSWYQDYRADYINRDLVYIINGTGTSPNPSMYLLPNLELLEKNANGGSLTNTIPWVSFDYMYGFSNYNGGHMLFDKSVAREAGRMIRKAGAKGFIVYANALDDEDSLVSDGYPAGYGYNYWLDNAKEMIAGFKEGLTYVEKNKIRNPSFEALKTKADDYGSPGGEIKLLGDIRFIPVFWTWQDTNLNYNDSSNYANLSLDYQSGMRSWKHTRYGDIGNRTILSQNFTVDSGESGNYLFSIYTKSSIVSSQGTIKFSLLNLNKNTEQPIGQVNFVNSWNQFTNNSVNIPTGQYKLKILIQDKTAQKVSVYFDNLVLEKI